MNTQHGLICKFYYKNIHSGSLNLPDSETHNHYTVTNSEDMVEFILFFTVSATSDLARIENVLV